MRKLHYKLQIEEEVVATKWLDSFMHFLRLKEKKELPKKTKIVYRALCRNMRTVDMVSDPSLVTCKHCLKRMTKVTGLKADTPMYMLADYIKENGIELKE